MIYEAIYEEQGYVLAKKICLNWVQNDSYYAMYSDEYGTQIVMRQSDGGCWGDYILIPPCEDWIFGKRFSSLEEIKMEDLFPTFHVINWTRSSGNYQRFRFDHNKKEVTMHIDSKRHGIMNTEMKIYTPKKVLQYLTQRSDIAWWKTTTKRGYK
jgi:hypothetical protein